MTREVVFTGYLKFLSIILILCLFRWPIRAMLAGQYEMIMVLASMPFFCVLVPLVKAERRLLLLSKSKSVWVKAFFCYVGSVTIAELALIFINEPVGLALFKNLSSTTIFLLFPLALYALFEKVELRRVLHFTLTWASVLAFVLTLLEFVVIKLQLISPQEIRFWLMGFEVQQNIRINTYLGLGAISGLVPLAGFLYFLNIQIYDFKTCSKLNFKHIFLILLTFFTIVLCDSFTLILLSVVLGLFSYFCLMKGHDSILGLKRFLIVFLIPMIFFGSIVSMTDLPDRFYSYFFRGEIYTVSSLYFPQFVDCPDYSLLTGIFLNGLYSFSEGCRPGEFHELRLLLYGGLIFELGWFLILFSPMYYFTKTCILRKCGEDVCGQQLLLCALPFTLSTIHYGGAEIWGNNYILAMLIVTYLLNTEKPHLKATSA